MESIHVLRLDDKSGPEGCIFHGTNTPGGQSLPQIIFPGKDIPIYMSALRPSMYPVGLHQDPKATRCSVETTGNAHDCQHIDNFLILAGSRKLAREHVIGLIYLLENLGFVITKMCPAWRHCSPPVCSHMPLLWCCPF